ncbi:hypothetical protein [Peterkaempfera bronchialis]|uniref:Uncharacterized protein n=1 Tax=Peterkaempfera bronchialis TaxID=2126346 RepID=A0A345SUS0_9ACTN|nr:hypothetical protein [Peterkaempfera bronchialis]AXI77475.1 hypothetical protein C7M71_008505 [Peterkaempfera bronchialis]
MGMTGDMGGAGPQDTEAVIDLTPPAPEPAAPGPGPRWLGPLVVIGLPVALAAVVGTLLYRQLSAPDGTDARACPGSTESLDSATARYGVRLPAGAVDVHYLADPGGAGGAKVPLHLAYRVPRATLDASMEANGLALRAETSTGWLGASRMCGLEEPSTGVARWTGVLLPTGYPVTGQVSVSGNPDTAQVLLQVGG